MGEYRADQLIPRVSLLTYRWTCKACGYTEDERLTPARAAYERRIARTGVHKCEC